MTEDFAPKPDYETPFGRVKPATLAQFAYTVPVFIAVSSLTFAVLTGKVTLPTDLGTALWVGAVASVVTGTSIRGYSGRWKE